MADNLNALKTSPEQYLERAKIIRRRVETMSNADVCRQLLDIAERYEELADGIERPALMELIGRKDVAPAG